MNQQTDTRAASGSGADAPAHRYTARLAAEIEARWQKAWAESDVYRAPNPGEPGFDPAKAKSYILDMFPYPSGAGLHVGHPLGYIATDIFARYQRMTGRNVLHAMGFDAFGLPAEQYAIDTGTHPRVTTEKNIATFRKQLARLGLGHERRRGVATTDVEFYKWTQWIFLQIYNSWYDASAPRPGGGTGRARPIAELVEQFESGERPAPANSKPWAKLDERERARMIDSHRLAYLADVDVNWCPALGTVLANEEVTAEGRSERGNHPVFKRPLRQWMMRITAYAERLLDDLGPLDWPEPIKLMQRNWIGRSEGAWIDFDAGKRRIRVFTTRPDTVYGATYMVLSPEHPFVDELTAEKWGAGTHASWKGAFPGSEALVARGASPRETVAAYRKYASSRSERERQAGDKTKTGVFIGAYALNPASGERVPVFIADYVLMGYGTGAIMAVPAHDTRDLEFAEAFGLTVRQVVKPDDESTDWRGFTGDGTAVNSGVLDGMRTPEAKRRIAAWLEEQGRGKGTVQYKLRDWLFSRQRYWGEPFPIVYRDDDEANAFPIALPESELPVTLPDMDDFRPVAGDDPTAAPQPPLGRATEWAHPTLDLGDGPRRYRRELNTMPQWAGSCWYYLRYLDPENNGAFVAPEVETYWMSGARGAGGGVDLYVGGAEHAVLHLLYARFWHKVLFDLGRVSTVEPFHKLFNQGYIQAPAFTDERGVYVEAHRVVEASPGQFMFEGRPVSREFGKMGKSLKNVITPDDVCEEYGADTMRLYEMAMGPLEQSKPWNPRDIVGVQRFLQRVWRSMVDEDTGAVRVSDAALDEDSRRVLHKSIDGVRRDIEGLSFNTAISKLIEANNHLVKAYAEAPLPREAAESMTLLLAPFAPHFAEELWSRLGKTGTVVRELFPVADPALLVEDSVEIPVQVLGKVRGRITVPAGSDAQAIERTALADEKIAALLEGKTVKKVVVVPGKMVNIVAG